MTEKLEGFVDRGVDAIVVLSVFSPDGSAEEVTAIVDTGSNTALTLPLAIVEELDLAWIREDDFSLADDSPVRCDVHAAIVEWFGRRKRIEIVATGSDPLLGMSLMRGCRLTIDVTQDGLVRIEPLAND